MKMIMQLFASFPLAKKPHLLSGVRVKFVFLRNIALKYNRCLAGRAEFVRGLDMRDVKIDRTGVRAVLSRTDSSIEERRFTTEKDGTITVEEYEHPV